MPTEYSVDVGTWRRNFVHLIVTQGEMNARELKVTLLNPDGSEFDTTGYAARLYITESSGRNVFTDAELSGNIVSAIIPMISSAGEADAQIVLTKGEECLKICGIILDVCPSNLDEALSSDDDWSALLAILNDPQAVVDGIKADAEAYVNQATTAAQTATTKAAEAAESASDAADSAASIAGSVDTAAEKAAQAAASAAAAAEDAERAANAATVQIGTVTTGEAGGSASVVNSGTPSAAVLDFVIPRGEQGPQGPAGENQVTTDTATDITGLLKGAGGKVAQAVAGVDYALPGETGGVSSLNGLTGAVTLSPGTGIGISPGGSILTVNNTGVMSVNTGAGAITLNGQNGISIGNAVGGIVNIAGNTYIHTTNGNMNDYTQTGIHFFTTYQYNASPGGSGQPSYMIVNAEDTSPTGIYYQWAYFHSLNSTTVYQRSYMKATSAWGFWTVTQHTGFVSCYTGAANVPCIITGSGDSYNLAVPAFEYSGKNAGEAILTLPSGWKFTNNYGNASNMCIAMGFDSNNDASSASFCFPNTDKTAINRGLHAPITGFVAACNFGLVKA